MKKYKGAAFFDIDGTLVDERQGIFMPTEKTMEAMKKLKENGYLIGMATGRARSYILNTGIDFDCYITCNGALCEVDGVEIFNDYLSETELSEIVDYMNREDVCYELEVDKSCYVPESSKDRIDEMMRRFHIKFADGSVKTLKDISGLKVNKIFAAFKDRESLENMREHFKGKYSVLSHHSNPSADVGRSTMSKAVGVLEVIKHFGIDIENTYTFGDDGNDVEMISVAGCGVAMTPCAPELKEVADYITCSVKEDGVYNALLELGLID